MILKIFAVQDKQVEAYMQPFFSPTIGAAIRMLTDALLDQNSTFSKHTTDYTLYQIGEFDDANGTIMSMDPQRVLPLVDLLKTVS